MKFKKKILFLGVLCMCMAIGLTGCKEEKAADVLPPADEPLVIEMYGTLDEGYLPFFQALTKQFPEIELRYEFQWDIPGVHEAERRILHGDGPDLAVVNGAALFSLTEKDLLLDLSNTPFSTRYHVSTMATLNDKGRVVGIPLPNDLRCLICNRDILEKNGVAELPKDISELIEICRILSDRGQGALIADEQAYQMILRTTYLNRPEGYDWLQAFNEGTATMEGTPAADAWKLFEELAAVSGCSQEDAGAQPAARTSMVQDGKYAFRSATMSNLRFMLEANPELNLIALPLVGETEDDQWAFYAEKKNMRYFVANGALAQPENAAKKEYVLQILDWISTEEAQQILASCGSAVISYVQDVELEQDGLMEYMDPVIKRGHLTSSDSLERGVGDVAADCTAKIAGGNMTSEEAVLACDMQNKEYVPPEEQEGLDEVVGTAKEPIYWRKPAAVTIGSPMAQLAAIAMAEAFPEADFAFAMAKNAASTLYPGDITMKDVLACADGEENRELMLVQADGAQIKALIDAGVGSPVEATYLAPYGIMGKGRLLYPAGLTYRADITREAGDKLTELVLEDGSELDMEQVYTIAVSGLLVDRVAEPNLKDCQMVPTGKYLRDVLADYIRNHQEVSAPDPGFEILGGVSH